MERRALKVVAVVAVFLLVLLACSGTDDDALPTTVPSVTVSPDTSPPDTSPPDTPPPDTPPPDTPPSTAPPDTPPADTPPATAPPDAVVCDDAAMLAVVDATIERARLAPSGEWVPAQPGDAFDDRTRSAGEFADLLALDCSLRLTQRTDADHERLVVAAWTGARHGFVVQATDPPSTDYERVAQFELFIEQPRGEWFEEQFVWASTLSGGESIVLATHDHSIAVTAKSWWSGFPGWDDLPVRIEAERMALDALVAAGARNASVAEPASVGSELGQIQLNTHRGLFLVAMVAPVGWFDPMFAGVEGATTTESIGGVDVRFTMAEPSEYAIGTFGWSCGGYDWWFDALYGDLDEYREFVERLIAELDC